MHLVPSCLKQRLQLFYRQQVCLLFSMQFKKIFLEQFEMLIFVFIWFSHFDFMCSLNTRIAFDRFCLFMKIWNVWEKIWVMFSQELGLNHGNQNACFYCYEQFNTGLLATSIWSVKEKKGERWKICCGVFRIGVSIEKSGVPDRSFVYKQ